MIEPEYITIVEGPTPDFRPTAEFAVFSILEGPQDTFTTFCEMRTLNGADILARCQQAWKDGRPVRLDYPDEMRMRKELDVVALRLEEVEESTVLQVWVRQPFDELTVEERDEDDEDNFPF